MRRSVFLLALALVGLLMAASSASAGTAPVSWCGGTQQTSTDRTDTVNGLQWHVIYAVAADSPDRFAALVSDIVTDIAAMDAWWRGQDSTRAPRFDLALFAGCTTAFGALDISWVRLPRAGAEYQDNTKTVDLVRGDLNALGFNHPDKKYLVIYDGPFDNPTNCGKGITGRIDGGANGYAVIFLAACSAQLGTGTGDVALTITHEMIHAMNALPVPFPTPGPPNVCPNDLGHPCDSQNDIMFPTGSPGDTFASKVLDVNRDDYYGHTGDWWNIRSSLFLQQLDSADVTPPGGVNPKKVTATSVKRKVTFRWPKATGGGLLGYRVYTDDERFMTSNSSFVTTKKRGITLLGPKLKRIILLGVRAMDRSGNLGRLREIRFRVGVGIVNAKGKLIKDTVRPSSPKLLKSRFAGAGIQLRWRKANDLGRPIKGYRIERNKRLLAILSPKARSFIATSKGTYHVRAIDKANNLSLRVQSVKIS